MESKENSGESASTELQVWKPQVEGEFLEGIYREKRQGVGNWGKEAYYIQSGQQVYLRFATVELKEKMKSVEPGSIVRITYRGLMETEAGMQSKLWDVEEVDRSNVTTTSDAVRVVEEVVQDDSEEADESGG